jgi:hypothetical protein
MSASGTAADGTGTGGAVGASGDATDDELIARLRRIAAEADPVPQFLLSAARAAFALRDIDARVAELVRDSLVDAPATPVRAGGTARGEEPRMLSFEAGSTAIECEVMARAGGRDIRGQLSGAPAATIEAEAAGSPPVSVTVGAHGWFTVRGLPSGPFRLRCRMADGETLVTSWTSV